MTLTHIFNKVHLRKKVIKSFWLKTEQVFIGGENFEAQLSQKATCFNTIFARKVKLLIHVAVLFDHTLCWNLITLIDHLRSCDHFQETRILCEQRRVKISIFNQLQCEYKYLNTSHKARMEKTH